MDLDDIAEKKPSEIGKDAQKLINLGFRLIGSVKTYHPLAREMHRFGGIGNYKMVVLVPQVMRDEELFDPLNNVMIAYGLPTERRTKP